MMDKMKDLYKLQKQAKQMKKELSAIHIEAEANGITVIVSWEMNIIDIVIPDEALWMGGKKIAKSVQEAFEKGKKKSEQISAEKMKSMMGGGGFPGLS